MHKIDCMLLRLKRCMAKSMIMKSAMKKGILEEIVNHCEKAGEISIATDVSIKVLRGRIERLLEIQTMLGKTITTNPTVFQYLHRVIFCLKVKRFYIINH